MFQIGICDDEAGSRALLAGYARTLIQHQGLNFRLQEYASAEALLSAQDKPEILLLDVQMGGMDGVMAAKTCGNRAAGRSSSLSRIISSTPSTAMSSMRSTF